MPTYKTVEEPGFAAVSFEGASDVLHEASIALRVSGFSVDAIGHNSILLRDVREASAEELGEIAAEFNLRPLGAYGKKTFMTRELVVAEKPLLLPLIAGKWYFSESNRDSYPFVRVHSVRLEKTGNNGATDQVVKLDMYSTNQEMPQTFELSSSDVALMQLRAATEDDFVNMDWIVPTQENLVLPVQPSHGIPDPNLDPSIMQPAETLQPNPIKDQHWQ